MGVDQSSNHDKSPSDACGCAHEHEPARRRLVPWLETGSLLLVAAFLGYSFFADRLRFFVAPQYVWLPPLAALALLAMFAARLAAHLRGRGSFACCEPEEPRGRKMPQSVYVAVLVVPIVFALAVDPTQFSPEGLRKRRVSGPPRDVQLEQAINWVLGLEAAERKVAQGPVSLPSHPTVVDLLGAATQGNPKDLEDRFVTVIGQCDLPGGGDSDRFDLYRLVVTCCIADATAVSIEISGKPARKLRPGAWISVGGRLKFDNPFDPTLPVVHAVTISQIDEPSEPYL